MATQYTNLLGLMYPGALADLLGQADLQNSAQMIDNYFAKFLANALPKGGFVSSTDYNITAGTGAEILISVGGVFNLTANGPKLNINSAPVSKTPSNSGMVTSGGGGTTNYLWVNPDGTFTVNQSTVAPVAGAQLAAQFNATTTPSVTGINNNPTGRINLDKQSYQVSVAFDFGSIANGGQLNTTLTVAGVVPGDQVIAHPTVALAAGLFIPPCQVTAADTVRLTVVNMSGGAVDPPNTTFIFYVRKF